MKLTKPAEFIYNNRILIFIMTLLLTAWAPLGMKKLRFLVSNESYFVNGDQTLEVYNNLKDEFGSDEFVYLLFEQENAFTKESLETLQELTSDLEDVSYVSEVISLINAPFVEATPDGMINVKDLVEEIPETQPELDSLKDVSISHNFYKDRLISFDGKILGITVRTDIIDDEPSFRFKIRDEIYKVIDSEKYADLKIHIAGIPINMPTYQEMIKSEMQVSLKLGLFLIIIILFFMFKRRVSGILATLLVIILSILITFGTIGILDIPLSMISTILIVLLICVGVGDSVHIIADYQVAYARLNDKKKAYIEAFSKTFIPCLMTSLTTSLGFLSLLVSKIPPVKQFGIFAALGALVAFIFTFSVSAFLLGFMKTPKKMNAKSTSTKLDDFWSRIMLKTASISTSKPKLVLTVTVLLLIVAFAGIPKIDVNSDLRKSFKPDHRIRKDIEYIDEKMNGTVALEVMIDTKNEGGIKDPELMTGIEKLQEHFVAKHENVLNAFSVVDIIKEVNKVLNHNDNKYFSLPKNMNSIAQLLLLYELSDADRLNDYVVFDYSKCRINFRLKMMSNSEFDAVIDDLEMYLSENFSSVEFNITGAGMMMGKIKDYLTETQIDSFIVAFIVITIFMIIVFWSIKLGMFSMIPNLLPIVLVLGFTGLMGISLSVTTVIIAAIALGIIVDDTIHFLYRFKKSYAITPDTNTAINTTLESSGRAITFTSLSLVIAFSIFLISDFIVVKEFGILIVLTVLFALLSDLIILPAFITIVKPKLKNKN